MEAGIHRRDRREMSVRGEISTSSPTYPTSGGQAAVALPNLHTPASAGSQGGGAAALGGGFPSDGAGRGRRWRGARPMKRRG